ncbi:MAG: PH-like domain-containing protein [Microbacteriaceae bacterium]
MNSSNIVATIVIAIVLLLILAGMYAGWQGRRKRQSHLAVPAPAPADPGRVLVTAEVTYLATTIAGDPLDRVVVGGLGFRAQGTMTVAETGVLLSLAGGTELFIPARELTGAGQATWTVDRAVEEGGLLLLGWTMARAGSPGAAGVAVESYLRVIDPAGRQPLAEAVRSLLPASDDTERRL